MDRVGIFVDVQNIWKTFGKIKYDVLLANAQKNRKLVRASAFMSYDPEDEGQHNFMRALSHLGYRVVSKPIRRLPDGSIKGNIDLEFAIDALTLGKYLDVAVLVTGDGDFVKLVEALGHMGTRVEVIGPDANTAIELIYAADHYTNLSHLEGIVESPESSGDRNFNHYGEKLTKKQNDYNSRFEGRISYRPSST
jgi:uncharacterized LabA/DUF88 family protein